MQPILPNRDQFELPSNTVALTYAKDQPEYLPLPCLRTEDGRVITQWEPTAEELDWLCKGQPITIVIHTFNDNLQPVQVGVGGMNLT